MIIRHNLPNQKFTKLDRRVFANASISDGAVRLYGYMCGLRNGANFSDAYIKKTLDISQAVLYRRKTELKNADLLLIDQVSPRLYIAYIGYTGFGARQVKNLWKDEEDLSSIPD
jgi:hypothetical protein